MHAENKTLWELLWDYDPNGLVAVNPDMIIQVVNPAFCTMFKVDAEAVVGRELSGVLQGDIRYFREAWEINRVIRDKEKAYLNNTLCVRKVIFPIRAQNIIACIMVDLTPEWHRRNELKQIRQQTIAEVDKVVDEQMRVAQEIAGLLGETTAETKISLLRLVELLEKEVS
jgi:PAS domain-containing protein